MSATYRPLTGPLTQAEVEAAINPTPVRGHPQRELPKDGTTQQSRARDRRAWLALVRAS
jgi:hypothetical protein